MDKPNLVKVFKFPPQTASSQLWHYPLLSMPHTRLIVSRKRNMKKWEQRYPDKSSINECIVLIFKVIFCHICNMFIMVRRQTTWRGDGDSLSQSNCWNYQLISAGVAGSGSSAADEPVFWGRQAGGVPTMGDHGRGLQRMGPQITISRMGSACADSPHWQVNSGQLVYT